MSSKIINLISGPRNLSTALMYSFAQRSDTAVVDEPFYAHYLLQTGVDHPGRAKVIASMENDANKVIKSLLAHDKTDLLFIKGMAHHLIDMDLSFLDKAQNIFLIRNPEQLIASFAQVIEQPTMRDIGLAHEWELFEQLRETSGKTPLVLDSSDLLQNPVAILSSICAAIGVPFDQSMLSWEAGGRPEDGIWNTYWYQNVHQSTGFERQESSQRRHLPEHCEQLYQEAKPIYNKLRKYAIKA